MVGSVGSFGLPGSFVIFCEAKVWTHRLGNLLLLNRRKNSSACNYDFD
ncbi:DUF1524 domain-containing protein, partial [Corynebacterium aurimucosum]